MRNLILLGIFCVFITNCSPTYMVKYEEPEPDIVSTEKLTSFLDNKDEVKVVLRTPAKNENMTEESAYSPIFNTIEKELLKANYIVRDRAIFNQVVSTSAEKTNYSQLQEQTDTDLIIELVDFDTKLPYTTNTYYSDGEEKTFQYGNNITNYGAVAEFRIVLLEDNQFAGSYSFNYAPCTDGCPIKINSTGEPRFVERELDEELNDNPYQYVSKPVLEQFIRSATTRLIEEMK